MGKASSTAKREQSLGEEIANSIRHGVGLILALIVLPILLIAGTYTPFTLGVLRGPWGWTLLALVWSMTLAGITLNGGQRLPHLRGALVCRG